MVNPLNVREILIFGGRTLENNNMHPADYLGNQDDTSFVAANLFTLNIDECTLKQIDTKNDPDDTVNVPEARLNHICQRNIEGHIVLNYNREEAKSKKKNGRRIFDITAKKKEIVGQAVTLVFGGFKANSPGFCDCSMFELYFVPNLTRKKKEEPDIKFAAPEEKSASVLTFQQDDNTSYISKLSVETFDMDERSSAERTTMFDRSRSIMLENDSCSSLASSKALKLKPDCSTQLLSPKRGVDGHYFDLKSALSFSKSSFIPSSSKAQKYPESESHAPSVLDPLSHKGGGSGGEDDEDMKGGGESVHTVSSNATVLSAERMHFMSAREIMKTRMMEIAPKTKGMTVHNARSVYNRLYPLPGLPNSLKRKTHKKLK